MISSRDKKLSYHRETARQLPTWPLSFGALAPYVPFGIFRWS